jgi:hypothetical protein
MIIKTQSIYKVIGYLSVILLGLSCSKKEKGLELVEIPKPETVLNIYLFTNEEHLGSAEAAGTAYFTYNNAGSILKREGGFLQIPGSFIYLREIFDTISFSGNNTITIEVKANVIGVTMQPSKRELMFNNDLLSRKIAYGNSPGGSSNDTTYYFYDASGKLQKTEQYFSSIYYVKTFFFDSKGNLIKITGIRKLRSDNAIINTTEEVFSGFDSNPNPLKIFNFWDDTFLRSLSANNFKGYSYIKKDPAGNTIKQEQKNWTLVYDAGGIPDFSR